MSEQNDKIRYFRVVKLSKASIIGQSTFGMKETEGEEFEELQIKDASRAVGDVLRNLKDKSEVDLLHVNCEVSWILIKSDKPHIISLGLWMGDVRESYQ